MSDESEIIGFGEDELDVKRKYSLENVLNTSEAFCRNGAVLEVNEDSEIKLKNRVKSGANRPYIVELSPIEKRNRHYNMDNSID